MKKSARLTNWLCLVLGGIATGTPYLQNSHSFMPLQLINLMPSVTALLVYYIEPRRWLIVMAFVFNVLLAAVGLLLILGSIFGSGLNLAVGIGAGILLLAPGVLNIRWFIQLWPISARRVLAGD